ncbi:SPOR domain-containing protein, partial [Bordetella hinzii]|nr:SPOR domain-containing protein [Bordetella hinzii]
PEPAPKPPATALRGTGIYLQLGAFSQPGNAQSLVSRINGLMAGEPAAIVEQANNLYRVRMGPYASREAAMDAVQRVSDRTGILPSLASQ